MFISVSTARDRVGQPQVVVIDAREALPYRVGHLPGAIRLHWKDLVNESHPVPGMQASAEETARRLGEAGMSDKNEILVYGEPSQGGTEDGRLLWAFFCTGKTDAKIISGGYAAWVGAGFPVERLTANTLPPAVFRPGSPPPVIASRDEVLQAVQTQNATLLDVRSADEFIGQAPLLAKRKGRIPGAIHVPFAALYRPDGTPRSAQDTRDLLIQKGVPLDKPMVCYCGIGARSAQAWAVLTAAGLDARNYNGSWNEWSVDPSLPIEQG